MGDWLRKFWLKILIFTVKVIIDDIRIEVIFDSVSDKSWYLRRKSEVKNTYRPFRIAIKYLHQIALKKIHRLAGDAVRLLALRIFFFVYFKVLHQALIKIKSGRKFQLFVF